MTKLIFLDTETTGLDPTLHEVWEVGFIVRDPASDLGDLHRLYRVYPDLAKAAPEALQISGFYDRTGDMRNPVGDRHAIGGRSYNLVDGFSGKPSDTPLGGNLWSNPTVLADELARELMGAHVVGAVPWFDAALSGSFLATFLAQHGQRLACHYHLVDVEALAIGYLAAMDDVRLPPWRSDDLSTDVGVDPETFDRHSALGDARWARAIFDKIMNTGRT